MITKKVFTDLAIFMIGFGIVIGIAFPFFVLITGTPASYVLTPLFFALCTGAGAVVGLFNIFLSRKIVGSKIKQLSRHMKKVEHRLSIRSTEGHVDTCSDLDCIIHIDSEDEFGEGANSFNQMVKSLSKAFTFEDNFKDFTKLISSTLELDKLSDAVLTKLIAITQCSAGAVLLDIDGDLKVLSSVGISNTVSLPTNDYVWKVIYQRERLILTFPDDIEMNGLLVKYKPKTLLIEPIMHKNIPLGVIVLSTSTELAPEAIDLLWLLGQSMSIAFRNAISHKQLQQLAAIDPLTNILNRRFGTERLKDEFTRSIRYEVPLGVLLFDIDHFKVINDTYGHIVGDKILSNLSKAVKTILREGDVFYRYGGEEFIVILPGASIKDVKKYAEQIRHVAMDMITEHQQQALNITVSVGGTSYPENVVIKAEDLLVIADQKMYEAKENGRNQTNVA